MRGISVKVGAQNLKEELPHICFLVLSQVRLKGFFENWVDSLIPTEDLQDLMGLHGVHS